MVANLETPSIVIVNNLVDRVQGVHVWGQEMMCRCVSKDAKPVIDGHIAAKWLNVDLEDDGTDAARSWGAPPWWSKEWRDAVFSAIVVSRRRTGARAR